MCGQSPLTAIASWFLLWVLCKNVENLAFFAASARSSTSTEKLKATNSNIRQTDVLAQVLNGAIAPYFTADEFLPAGTSPGFGGAARNSVRGPGYFNTDLTVRKNFKLTEKTQFPVAGIFFNVLNRSNFANPLSNLANANQFSTISPACRTVVARKLQPNQRSFCCSSSTSCSRRLPSQLPGHWNCRRDRNGWYRTVDSPSWARQSRASLERSY